LPSTISIKAVTYGMPRPGNAEFANWIDANVPDFSHINNEKDIVPILPGRFLGFSHSNGEKHIYNSPQNQWVACSGHDNTDPTCTVGQVKNIFVGDTSDHAGPYDGVSFNGC
jgi:hypothetical protein